MPASEARIAANRANAAKSTGPKTPEGKEASRANALKHGLCAKVVLPERDAAEVRRRADAFAAETNARGDLAHAFARAAAINSVQMERAADQQTAALTRRIRQVEAEFVAPEGASPEEAAKLKDEEVRIAMIDPSKEATRVRQYQAAATRAFFRAARELQQMEQKARAETDEAAEARVDKLMASFLKLNEEGQAIDADLARMEAKMGRPMSDRSTRFTYPPASDPTNELPFAVGRRG